MKRLFSLLTVILLLILLCACNEGTGEVGSDGQKEEVHNPTVCTKDGVDEFLAIAGSPEGEGLLSGYSITRDNLYNVTPEAVSRMTDYKIFKASDSCASFILIDGEIHPICEYFGGYGFVSAHPCDYDEDGVTDLIVSSSFGSGIHTSVVSAFNGATKESKTLCTNGDREHDMIVLAQSPSFSSVEMNELPIYYVVYLVEIHVNDGNLANLSYDLSEPFGSIIWENGEILYIPNEG